jgi:hypothetical protein
MERKFSIEAKLFRFSIKEGSSLFRLEERRKKFIGYIFVSPQSSSWLIDTVEAACLVKENIAKSFREGDKALMVHGGENKSGRFLEVAVFAEGGRKGGIWLPKGRDGRGWRRFAAELRILLVPSDGGPVGVGFEMCPSPCSKPSSTKLVEAGAHGVCSKVRTFAEILKSKSRSCEEEETGGDEHRREAAGSVKMTRGSDVKRWVEPLLGLLQLGLGRVLIGLLENLLIGPDELPMRKRIRAVLKSLKASKVGPSLVPTSTGRARGFHKVKLGLKGNGLGCPFKPKKATVPGPSMMASEVRLPSSTPLFSPPACEECVGSSARIEISILSPVMENSQVKVAGEGFGAVDGAACVESLPVMGCTTPVTSEVGMVSSSDFGLPMVNIAEISTTTMFVSATPAIITVIPKWVEAAELVSGSPEVSVGVMESLGILDPGEAPMQGRGGGSVGASLGVEVDLPMNPLVSDADVELIEGGSGSTTGLVSGSMTSVESPTVASRSLGFGLPTSSSVSPTGSASVEDGLEKTMGCYFGDGIPTHGCEGVLSSEAALFLETVQGRQNPPFVSLTTDPVSLGLELDANSHLVSGLVPSGDGPVGDGSDGDGSGDDLGLTVSQLGLIERFRKAVLATEENKRIVKQVENNFIRVNKDMHDGVMPAEEGEAVLAAYVRVIKEFLGEKRERAHIGLPGQRGA